MTVCGIIAEYNPFHNGHLYHIEKSRQLSGADYIAVILSGSFVQRGAPAFVDKYVRTRMALEAGADLVIELPALFSCASAEDFTGASISLLDQLGVTDYISFGTESRRPEILESAARILAEEPPEFSAALKSYLKKGLSFPKAREAALKGCVDSRSLPWTDETAAELSSPNNILALEYFKALYRRHSSIVPIAVPRAGAGYHSTDPREPFCSASAVRNFLTQSAEQKKTGMLFCHSQTGEEKAEYTAEQLQNDIARQLSQMLPAFSRRLLAENWQQTCPVLLDDFSSALAYRLLSGRSHGYTSCLDVSEDLSRRIAGHAADYRTFSQWVSLLKTRQYTYTRISRVLCHILLQIPRQLADTCREQGYTCYARILGFRKDSTSLLSAIKKNSSIPVFTRVADADTLLSPTGKSILQTELFASRLYNMVRKQKFPSCPVLSGDYTAGPALL